MFPPNIDWMPPTKLPTTERERTVRPRTMPMFLVTRYPGSSYAVVIMEFSIVLPCSLALLHAPDCHGFIFDAALMGVNGAGERGRPRRCRIALACMANS